MATAQKMLMDTYGPPNTDYFKKYCELWEIKKDFAWFPTSHFLVNEDFKKLLKAAFKALEAQKLHKEIKTYDGCYNDRAVRGSKSTSLHAWAAAIDLNATLNPMQLPPKNRNGKWSDAFIKVMIANGIFFGGAFKRRADPMHWALLDG